MLGYTFKEQQQKIIIISYRRFISHHLRQYFNMCEYCRRNDIQTVHTSIVYVEIWHLQYSTETILPLLSIFFLFSFADLKIQRHLWGISRGIFFQCAKKFPIMRSGFQFVLLNFKMSPVILADFAYHSLHMDKFLIYFQIFNIKILIKPLLNNNVFK